ncbi:ABC transporter ATP-binding protein [Sporomusa sphaeroides]|uniref:Aliphatic sulfonates import ATP-binding protein SsuB n=2 Tax=Sporomusa TaxID=2375 RepID=A0ABP2C3V5_9FIRM|nr:ABC transporter ATP-binding protein [Sporomusa sphaeroides]OLS57012.1 aliphatic sulfonates import ATP-binding protein SsuB [Sporomusa sphaeroides DSM 2875]CVK18198.1 Aliphatic sulfonates import ATP-binding protein SsuB [Sporomusa sphaeroides DSM 2875]SCM81709.1 Aliphatic sulfonates import ATP-binding protein SsuB [uncultured Sporomusa sp.]
MIRIKNLSVAYEDRNSNNMALKDITLELAAGETCAIIGPSGCGKSTLLKVLAGIIKKFEGTVEINGQAVRPQKQKIGFIPQNYGLLPWKTIYENIRLGVKIKNKQASDNRQNQAAMVQLLGLDGLEHRYPGELSGGQQQRVALARAFLLQPDLLLMDEPFSALDAMTREEIQNVFLQVWRKHSVSTILVTHHVEEAVYLGRKIVILSATPGRVSKIIDNPLFGIEGVRNQQDFFRLSIELRKMIKEDWSK